MFCYTLTNYIIQNKIILYGTVRVLKTLNMYIYQSNFLPLLCMEFFHIYHLFLTLSLYFHIQYLFIYPWNIVFLWRKNFHFHEYNLNFFLTTILTCSFIEYLTFLICISEKYLQMLIKLLQYLTPDSLQIDEVIREVWIWILENCILYYIIYNVSIIFIIVGKSTERDQSTEI